MRKCKKRLWLRREASKARKHKRRGHMHNSSDATNHESWKETDRAKYPSGAYPLPRPLLDTSLPLTDSLLESHLANDAIKRPEPAPDSLEWQPSAML